MRFERRSDVSPAGETASRWLARAERRRGERRSRISPVTESHHFKNTIMRYIGIDFGSKKIGIALSDEGNALALPYKVLPNGSRPVDQIVAIIKENSVTDIILGQSKDFKGADNPIMKKIEAFKKDIEERTGLKVIFEPEYLTSRQARQIQGETDMHDASAAALILQSYLDRLAHKQSAS